MSIKDLMRGAAAWLMAGIVIGAVAWGALLIPPNDQTVKFHGKVGRVAEESLTGGCMPRVGCTQVDMAYARILRRDGSPVTDRRGKAIWVSVDPDTKGAFVNVYYHNKEYTSTKPAARNFHAEVLLSIAGVAGVIWLGLGVMYAVGLAGGLVADRRMHVHP